MEEYATTVENVKGAPIAATIATALLVFSVAVAESAYTGANAQAVKSATDVRMEKCQNTAAYVTVEHCAVMVV